jgi:hypothetical protein
MNYLTLNGVIDNVLLTPQGTNKDTGEQYGGRNRVQLIISKTLSNGEVSREFVNLNVDDVRPFSIAKGKLVSVPVGAMADGKSVRFYHVRAASPPLRLLSEHDQVQAS